MMLKNLCKATVFMGLVFCSLIINAQGGVAINPAGALPDNSAALDVNFTNKGFLMPRLSTIQRDAIASPANGLQIFNTDCNVINFNAGTPSSPNWATVNSSNVLVASVNIAANPVGAICAGTSVTFTATPSNGINNPTYQWKLNGSNAGTNSTTYTNANLSNGDVVTCVLTSNMPCVTGSPATSNSIAMTVSPVPSTPGPISGSASICPGSSGNAYSISPVAGATSYNWSVPGDAAITVGAGSTSITVTFGTDSGTVSVAAANSCGVSNGSSMAVTVSPSAPGTPGAINGQPTANSGSANNLYYVNSVSNATTYNWSLPAGASITSGAGTDSIRVTFGANSGNISVTAANSCGTSQSVSMAITVCNGYNTGNQTFNYSGSRQNFTVPSCVYSLTIEALGAQGGNSNAATGGYGADMKGTFAVNPGDVLTIGVGQQAPVNSNSGGGGGSSGVLNGSTLLIVAGGGGGGGATVTNLGISNAVTGTSGQNTYGCPGGNTLLGSGGTNGSGGGAGTNPCGDWPQGSGGAGVNSDGGNANGGNNGPCSGGLSSGAGGTGDYINGGGNGGYGFTGGGGASYGGGGGGGYSGGAGGASSPAGNYISGGGGGSYNSGTNQTNSGGVQSGNGQVIFTW